MGGQSLKEMQILTREGLARIDNGHLLWNGSCLTLVTETTIRQREIAVARKNEKQALVNNRVDHVQAFENNAITRIRQKYHQLALRGGFASLIGVPVDGATWEWNSSKEIWTMPGPYKWAAWLRKEENREILEVRKRLRMALESEDAQDDAAQQTTMRRDDNEMKQGGSGGPSGNNRQVENNAQSGKAGKNIHEKKQGGNGGPSRIGRQVENNGRSGKVERGVYEKRQGGNGGPSGNNRQIESNGRGGNVERGVHGKKQGGNGGPRGHNRQAENNGRNGKIEKGVYEKKQGGIIGSSGNNWQSGNNGQNGKFWKGGQTAGVELSGKGASTGQKGRGMNISRNF